MGRARAPIGETKEEKFKRVVTLRVRRLLKDLRLLGNLAINKQVYSYTDEDVDKIFSTIEKELKRIKNLFYINLVSVDDILNELDEKK